MKIVRVCCWLGALGMSAVVVAAAEKGEQQDVGPYVRALWAVQRFGRLEAADPRNDGRTKARLAAALGKNGSIGRRALESELMDAMTFERLAGANGSLEATDIARALDAAVPETRRRLVRAVAAHLDLLTTSFDRIDAAHLAAAEKLADWMVANYERGKPLPLIFVCTGNTRRSVLGATMANVAAAYWGLPEIHGYSGGTEPSAVNPRTIHALESIGIAMESTGDDAERGTDGSPNPKYLIRWGRDDNAAPAMRTIEFSKHYGDEVNPHSGFAALMVCAEADAECRFVKGASRRISMPYLDPKSYDESQYETLKYAERRDDFGRLMLAAMLKARRQLEAAGKIALPPTSPALRW